jgi:hypothetical protein
MERHQNDALPMKYQHRVLGLLSLLSVITYIDRVCIAVSAIASVHGAC